MDKTWIITANAGRARLFSQEGNTAPLQEVTDMVNTEVRLRTVDTESDQIGQLSASKSKHSVGAPTQPSGYEPNQIPSEHQTEQFARSVAAFLLQGLQEHRYKKLVLAASPQFLGVLRKLLDPQVLAAVSLDLNKDYTQFDPRELQAQIQAGKSG